MEFLRSLTRGDLRAVKLVTADTQAALKAAVTKVLSANAQLCGVRFLRNDLVYAGKSQRHIVAARIGTGFVQEDAEAARKQWRRVADQAQPALPKLAILADDAEG